MITWSSDWAFPVRAMKCGYSSLIRRWRGTSLRPLGRPCPSRQRKACSCFKTNRRFHPLPVAAGPYHHPGNGNRGATVEVWSGDDSVLAKVLQDCLAENTIGIRVEGKSPGPLRLFVRPEEAPTAREIIREVVQGTPPE